VAGFALGDGMCSARAAVKFALLNCSKAPADAMAKIGEALQLYLAIVCAAWERVPIAVEWMPGVTAAPAGTIALIVFDHPDAAGALGYHAIDGQGRPYGRAFLDVVPDGELLFDKGGTGASLAGVLSHEAAETALDVFAGFWSDGPLVDRQTGQSHGEVALELCDPVQEQAFAVSCADGTKVDGSNFVLPAWFSAAAPPGTAVDQMGVLGSPLSIAAGGYAIVRDAGADGQVEARKRVYHPVRPANWRESTKKHPAARTARRLRAA